MKQQFLKSKVGTIRLTVFDKNTAQVPTSAAVTLYRPGSTAELQAQATATVNASTGEMTYALTATHTGTHDINYKAVWEYVVDGVTYYETQLFDVVKSILSIPITDDDLFAELESLRKVNKQATGTATGGTTSTLIDTSKRKESDDYWKGGVIEILSGTNIGQTRPITSFSQTTSTITVSPDFGSAIDATSIYRIVGSFYGQIVQSFKKIETMLYNKGRRDSLILESSQIEIPLLYLTIHSIALDLMSEPDDKWAMIAKEYNDKFDKAFNTMTLEYDEDESGTIEGEEEKRNVSELRIYRS